MKQHLASIYRALFPPARRETNWWSALPLLVFLAAFVALCCVLHFGELMRFNRPIAFLFMLVAPWIWWMHHAGSGGLSGGRALTALLTRLSVFGLFIILLADPRAVRTSDSISIVYSIDLSDSVGEAFTDQAIEYMLTTVGSKRDNDNAGLIVFGRDAAVELPPRKTLPYETINSQIPRDGTNLAESLNLAAAVIQDENAGRIILVSDGGQNQGDLDQVLDLLRSRGITVDVLPANFEIEDEVWLERLDLPRTVKSGETYEASVVLSSLKSGSGTLVLEENGEEIGRDEIDFTAGKNRFALPLYMRGPGYYEYTARILVDEREDGWKENNIAMGEIFLRGEGKILIVTDPEAEADEQGNYEWTLLQAALQEGQHIVEVMDAYSFPRTSMALLPYDAIIFVNAPADAFDAVQLRAVRDSVYDQGTGFLMVGGDNSFGPGGYHRTAIEEALPVTMDVNQKKVLPKGALAIILHTCEFEAGNTWGKRIAKEAIRVLGAKDEVGVLAYSYGTAVGDQWLFPLTPASEYPLLALKINAAQIGDMPSFSGTMTMAFNALNASDAAMKHSIIISDGDPSPPTPALLKQYADAGISISTVAINPHQGMDTKVMENIAQATKGRFFFPKDPRQLPSIFIKEAKTLKRSMIQNVRFTPEVVFPSPILKGMDAVRELKGYVLTTPKGRGQLILKGPEEEEDNPVLSTWRFGTGVTAAWTSDLSANWASAWVGSSDFSAFTKQLLTEIARPDQKSDLHAHSYFSGNTGVISVEDFSEDGGFMDVRATVRGPHGRSETLELRQVAGRRYEVDFPLWGKGRYQVAVAGVGGASDDGTPRSERAASGFTIPYSLEYLDFRSDMITLERIAEATGGRVLNGQEKELFGFDRDPHRTSRSVIDWFLIALICLVPLDVGIRRVQIDWTVFTSWFRRAQPATAAAGTMGALLKRKEQVQSTMESVEPDPIIIPKKQKPKEKAKPDPLSQEKDKAPAKSKPKPKGGEPDWDSMSTTEKLLARKRKRKEGEE